MPRLIVIALVLLALPPFVLAEDAPPVVELPATVERLLKTHQEGIDKVQEIYVKAVEKLDETLLAGLQREKSKAMKAEDLDLALSLDAKIKEIEEAKPKTDILGKPIKVNNKSIPERLCAQPWVGTVAFLGDFIFAFKADGTYRVTNREGMQGTWKQDEKKEVILITLGQDTDILHYNETSDNWLYEKPKVGKFPFTPKPPEAEEHDEKD